MIITTYQNANEFLAETQDILAADEAANSLMLGICLRLRSLRGRGRTRPYLATAEDERGMVVCGVMTPPYNIVLHSNRSDRCVALELIAKDLVENHWPVPGVLGAPTFAQEMAATWGRLTGATPRPGMRQRVYQLTDVIHPDTIRGRLRLAEADDVDLVIEWISDFHRGVFGDGPVPDAQEMANSRVRERSIYLWDDDGPVSMAAKARPTLDGITVNLVYTPPEMRQRGYATACVAGLSQLLRDSGWSFCVLFADLANPTSNGIYQRLGYRPVGDYHEYVFRNAS